MQTSEAPFAKGRIRPMFLSPSKIVLELLMVAWSLKEKFGTCFQKMIVSYELRVEGLVPVYFIHQKALKSRRELGFRKNCNLQPSYLAGLGNSPKSGFCESSSKALYLHTCME